MITRRAFLKTGLAAAGALAVGTLTACSSSSSSTSTASSSASSSASSASSAAASSAASSASQTAAGKACVLCFSATGNTYAVAEKIAAAASAELIRIEAAEPYTSDDLNYNDTSTRATVEQNEGTARPEIAGGIPDVSAYDTVYLGYPIWWGKAPRIILTLLEGADFAGKNISLFCTSGSSSIDGSLSEIEAAAPKATFAKSQRFAASASEDDVKAWLA